MILVLVLCARLYVSLFEIINYGALDNLLRLAADVVCSYPLIFYSCSQCIFWLRCAWVTCRTYCCIIAASAAPPCILCGTSDNSGTRCRAQQHAPTHLYFQQSLPRGANSYHMPTVGHSECQGSTGSSYTAYCYCVLFGFSLRCFCSDNDNRPRVRSL